MMDAMTVGTEKFTFHGFDSSLPSEKPVASDGHVFGCWIAMMEIKRRPFTAFYWFPSTA